MYNQLKAKIDLYIRTNGVRAITGAILNEVLNDMVDGLGTNAGFGGSITPSSEAPTTDSNIFFIASTAGTYTNFSGIVLASGELAFIHRQGNGWAKDSWTISVPDISGKADKVSNATNGNLAGLDNNGNLTDSGSKASDFATSQQGEKADTAYQKPLSGIPESDLSSDVQQALQKHFKGWFNTLAELKAAYTAVEGDSAYVKDASPATTWSIYVYDATATTDNNWADSGADADTSNVQTFESGEKVNETYIDDTHLVTPKDGALPTAADVLQLKAKLEGVTASEVKVNAVVGTNVTAGAFVNGETGLITTPSSSASSYAYFELAIPQGTKSIRFATGTKTSDSKIGYSIGHYEENVYVPTRKFYFDAAETTPPSGIVEKVIEVLEGETTFRTTVAGVSTYVSITLNAFYCYLQNGESVGETLQRVNNTLLGYNDDSIVSETDYASTISSGNILADLISGTEIVRGNSKTKVGGFLISSIGNFEKLRVIGYTSQNRSTRLIFTKLDIRNLASPGTYDFEYLSNNGYLCDGATVDDFTTPIPSGYSTPAGIEIDIPKDAVWCFIQSYRIMSGTSYSCAPSSVLPFSQHIQGEVEKKIDEKLEDYTPVTVVDSLESNSQTDALSANQGRVLGNYVKRVDIVFFYELATYSITSGGTFGANTDYRHSIIPVVEGEEYIIENNGTSDNIRYCFMDSTTCEAGGDIPLVDGTSVVTVNAGTSQKITIPVGCKYLSFTEDMPYLNNYKVLLYRITYISNKDFFNIVQFGESLPINNTEYHAKWNEIVNDGIATRSEPTYMSWDTNEEYPLYTYKISRQRQWMGSNYSVPPTGYSDYPPLYKRKKIMITAGIHGCERLTPSTLLKWIKEHINDTTFSTFDFVIIPLCNPWGYSHTMLDGQGNIANASHMSDNSLQSGYSIIDNTSTKKFGIRKTRKQSTDTQFIDINRDFNDTDGFITEEAQYVRDVYVAEKPDMVIDLHQDLNSGSQNMKCGFCSTGTSLVYLQDMADIQTKLFSLIDKAGYDTDNYVNRTFVNKQQYTYAWGTKPIDETEYTGEADDGVWKNYASGASSNSLHADCAVRYSFTFETDEYCRKINGYRANNRIAMEYGYLFLSNFLKYIFNVFEMK